MDRVLNRFSLVTHIAIPCCCALLSVAFVVAELKGQTPSEQESVKTPVDIPVLDTADGEKPSVGIPAKISSVVIPGSELQPKPYDDERLPIVLRIVAVYPHGTDLRYDFEYYGLDPGAFDLRDYLERVDGSSMDGVPSIPVEIQTILPAGQVLPNQLETGNHPRVGGYRQAAIALVALWVVGLLMLIFYGRRRAARRRAEAARQKTLADLLRERISSASTDALPAEQFAELERMLISFWRRRLDLDDVPLSRAIPELRAHEDAGPLLRQLESWMHDPNASQDGSLNELLEPYRAMPASALDQVAAPEREVVTR